MALAKTLDELIRQILEILPDATVDDSLTGEIAIWTGLKAVGPDEQLIALEDN